DKNIKDNEGFSALDYATSRGLRDTIALLVGETEEKSSLGNTPLHQAVWNNEAEVVNELLKDNNININTLNDQGDSALVLACMQNNLRIAQQLINAGADLQLNRLDGNSVLHYSSGCGNKEIVKLLIEKGMDINSKNNEGETPLLVAAICGHNDVSSLLIEAGANVNEKDNDQNSALHYASEKGFNEIVEQLIMAGADS